MAGIFNFSNDVLGIGNIIGSIKGNDVAIAQSGYDAQLAAQNAQLNAAADKDKKDRMLIAGIASGILFIAMLYVLLKD